MEYKGKCYYCKQDVYHEKPHDYYAFTKRWDKKLHRYTFSDYFHMSCYVDTMNRILFKKPAEEYKQLSLFD